MATLSELEYLGGMSVKANTTLSTNNLPSEFSTAEVVVFKSEKGHVSVDGTDFFEVRYGEVTYFGATPEHTYTFQEDVTLAFCRIQVIT